MDDLIKRQDAIGKIKDWMKFIGYSHSERNVMECTIQMLEELPSAQKTGKWIPWKAYYGEDRKSWSDELKCSECGYKWGDEEYKFCPSCGARMVGEEE